MNRPISFDHWGQRPAGARHPRWKWPSPLVVAGLTGGIASGKSTIARFLAELGAITIDADRVGREVVEPGEPALAEIVKAFGRPALRPDGGMDRAWVGQRIFRDAEARQILNRITHPRISQRIASQIHRLAGEATAPQVVVVEAAVLFDAGWDEFTDEIVLVASEQRAQVARLMERQALPEGEAWTRVRAQTPWHEQAPKASWIIRGDVPLEQTRSEVTQAWQELVRMAAERHA